MKLGFFTAALPGNTLEQAAKWGAESGFQAIEIACWPLEKASRRYAGRDPYRCDHPGSIQGEGNPQNAGWLRADDFRAGLLSKPAPPGCGAPQHGHRPPEKSHRSRRAAGSARGGNLHRQG